MILIRGSLDKCALLGVNLFAIKILSKYNTTNLSDTGHNSHKRKKNRHQYQTYNQGKNDHQSRFNDRNDVVQLFFCFFIIVIGNLFHYKIYGS